MRTSLRLLCVLLAWAALLRPGSAQAQVQTQFSCDGTFYQIRQVTTGTGTAAVSTSHLFTVDRSKPAYSTVDRGDLGVLVNALAYNSQDGYMYAVTYPNSTTIDGTTNMLLYRIGFAGTVPTAQVVATTTLPKGVKMATGTFDRSGNYFLSGENTQTNSGTYANNLYRIKPATLPTASTAATSITADALAMRNAANTAAAGITCYDIAFNPADNKIYGVSFPGALYQFNGANATATSVLITTYGAAAVNEPLGSAIFDISGALYAYSNGNVNTANSGKFYKINVTTAEGTVGGYTQLSSIDPAAISDGASCINPGNALDVVTSAPMLGTPISPTTFDVTYTIKVQNSGTSEDQNVQLTDFLLNAGKYSAFPGASSVTKQSLTLVNNTPTAGVPSTLVVNPNFTGTTNGGVNDNLLTTDQSLKVGQSATLTLTVRVVYPNAASVPLPAQNNSLYATSTTNTNPGYTYVTNGTTVTLVPPDNLVAYDLSTNSANLPGLVDANTGAHNDAASPTPVSFPPSISGTIFEDVNYGGGAGRQFDGTAGTVGRNGAVVELYDNTGAYISSTTTDASGNYAFQNLAAGTYTVRVVNSTVTSSRNTNSVTGLVGVETFVNGLTDHVGGEVPNKADAAANTGNTTGGTKQTLASLTMAGGTTTPQSITSVTLGAAKSDVDFGFNFDAVVNTNDSGQGSLRQFITNSNALPNTNLAQTGRTAGMEYALFMLNDGRTTNIPAGLRAGSSLITTTGYSSTTKQFTITDATALPTITDNNTAIDGSLQTAVTNDQVAAVPEVTTGPEVVLNFNGLAGLLVTGGSTRIASIGLNGANGGTGNNIGGSGVTFQGTTTANSIVTDVTTSGNVRAGVRLDNSGTNITVSNNVLNNNLSGTSDADGLEMLGTSNSTVSGNTISGNKGYGIFMTTAANTGNTISNNIIRNNGSGNGGSGGTQADAGISIAQGANNTFSGNTITGNVGDGIVAAAATANNIFTQNSISGNGKLGIDLLSVATGGSIGVTPNDAGDNDASAAASNAANGLINYPIISNAVLNSNGMMTVTGFARPNVKVELFISSIDAATTTTPSPSNYFGEGQTYLTSFTQAATPGTNAGVVTGAASTYGTAAINGLSQGTDNTNTFSYTFTPTAVQLALLRANGAALTSTSTLTTADRFNYGTSEFSGDARVLTPPVPNDVTNVTIASSSAAVALSPNLSATASGQVNDVTQTTANSIASYTVKPATNGTLYYNNVAVTATTGTSVLATDINKLTFAPTPGFAGNASFTYTATDANGTVSTTHNTNGTVTDGPAIYTIPVQPTDVTTSIAGPSTLNAGQPSGTYTVAFTNSSQARAYAVTQTVTLPSGTTFTTDQQTALTQTYPGTSISGTTITFPQAASLAAGASNVYQFAFTAPLASTTTASITSNVGTSSNQGGNYAPDAATLNLLINDVADVSTTIAGSAVAAGATASFTATFTNNGPQTANSVVGKVQLPLGLANVTANNSSTYDANTGVITYIINNLSSGSSAAPLTISYTQPASNVTATSAISTIVNEAGQTANNSAQATIAPSTTTNVATTISGPTSATVGAQVTYNVVTQNLGTATATSVAQTVTLPSGATNIFVTGGGVISGSTVTFPSIAALAAGQKVNNTISFTAPGTTPTSFNVVANVSATSDAVASDNTSTVTTNTAAATTGSANLYTRISTPSINVTAGTAVTFTVTQGNNGPNSAASVTSQVALPTGLPITVGGATSLKLNGATPSSVAGTVATYTGIGTYDSSTGLVTFTNTAAALTTGGSVGNVIAYYVPANGNASLVNTARVTSATSDYNLANNVAPVITTIQPSADVQVALTGPSSAVLGSTTVGTSLTYNVTTTNNGPSVAGSVTTTVQLPTGLSSVAVIGYDGTTLTNSTTTGYNSADGVVRFPAITNQASGGPNAMSGSITLTTPANVYVILPTATATLTSTTDPNLTNNTATVATILAAPTAAMVDLQTTISRTSGTGAITAGNSIAFTVSTINSSLSTAPASAGAITTVQLPAGLNSNGGTVTLTNSGTYDNATGLVTFTTTAALAVGNNVSNIITISQAPGAGPLVATASVLGKESDPPTGNNAATTTVAITAVVDVATTISGPASAPVSGPVTYTITTSNNGPSAATSVQQQVTLPVGITSYSVNGGAAITVSGTAATVVTLPTPSTIAAGPNNTVANTVSFAAPANASSFPYNVVANVTATDDAVTGGNNSATLTTTRYNQPPVATNVTNTLQSPEGNTATASMLISPLAATDAENALNATVPYQVVKAPASTQGILSYNNGGTFATVNDGQTLTATQAATLRFLPATGYIGNATFTYTATDNANAVSNVATYLIPVGKDNTSAYSQVVYTAGKVYQNADVVANVLDNNGARYNSAGQVYSTTNGTLVATDNSVSNGLPATGTNAVPATTTDATTLTNNGLALNAITGQITVADRTKLKTGTITFNITTTDVNGGVSTVPVSITLSNPLPVSLVAFTAEAVHNRDAQLSWSTASEQNNDHFEVERSLDGATFTTLGQLAGQGTTSLRTAYAYADVNVAALTSGPVYYRLKQVDLTGTSTYSPVRTVRFTKAAVTVSLSLYPNPAQTRTTLDLSQLPASATYQVLLLDATGRQVLATKLAGGLPQPLDLTTLATGTYNVLVTGTLPDGSLLHQVLRLTKE